MSIEGLPVNGGLAENNSAAASGNPSTNNITDNVYKINKNKEDTAETAGGVENNSGLSPTDNVSNNTVPQSEQTVTEKGRQ